MQVDHHKREPMMKFKNKRTNKNLSTIGLKVNQIGLKQIKYMQLFLLPDQQLSWYKHTKNHWLYSNHTWYWANTLLVPEPSSVSSLVCWSPAETGNFSTRGLAASLTAASMASWLVVFQALLWKTREGWWKELVCWLGLTANGWWICQELEWGLLEIMSIWLSRHFQWNTQAGYF